MKSIRLLTQILSIATILFIVVIMIMTITIYTAYNPLINTNAYVYQDNNYGLATITQSTLFNKYELTNHYNNTLAYVNITYTTNNASTIFHELVVYFIDRNWAASITETNRVQISIDVVGDNVRINSQFFNIGDTDVSNDYYYIDNTIVNKIWNVKLVYAEFGNNQYFWLVVNGVVGAGYKASTNNSTSNMRYLAIMRAGSYLEGSYFWSTTDSLSIGLLSYSYRNELNLQAVLKSYEEGYIDGYNEASMESEEMIGLSWLEGIFTSMDTVMQMEILPNIRLWYFVGFPLLTSLILFILKLIRGA
jgi:hypothetical protein